MSAETEAAVEAVAEARGLQFGYVRKEFGPEVRHVREHARQRAEEIEARLLDAQRALIRAIQESEGVTLSAESRALLSETLANIKRLIVIADRAIIDAYDQSWRQEFHLIGPCSASWRVSMRVS
jgi:hypothetical protein